MIELKGVNKYFNKRKANEIHVIDNTSITLGDTGLVTFLGSSGCGKTVWNYIFSRRKNKKRLVEMNFS